MRLPQAFTETSYLNGPKIVYDIVRKKNTKHLAKFMKIKKPVCMLNNYTMYIICIYIYNVLPIKVITQCILFAHIFTMFCL